MSTGEVFGAYVISLSHTQRKKKERERQREKLLAFILGSQLLQLRLQINAFPTPSSHPIRTNNLTQKNQ